MQVACVFDTGTMGQEFIRDLTYGRVAVDYAFGSALWRFETVAAATELLGKLLARLDEADIISVIFVGTDVEDLTQYMPL
jgi:hypothetical protein